MFKSFVRKRFTDVRYRYQKLSLSTEIDTGTLLAKYLKIDDNIWKEIQLNIDCISKIPRQRIIENSIIITTSNVSLKGLDYLRCCLDLHPKVVKRRIAILREMGVQNVNLHQIYRFPTSMRRSIIHFKKFHNISSKENILENIVKNLNVGTVNEYIRSRFHLNIRASDYFQLCMNYYKSVYLNLNNYEFNKEKNNTYQSFQEVKDTLEILQIRFNFDNKFLRKNTFLLRQDAENIKSFLLEFGETQIIGHLNIIDIAKIYPRILCCSSENVRKLLMLCKQLEIPEVSLSSYIRLLTTNQNDFLERYKYIISSLELSVWSKHPRMTELIQKHFMVKDRVQFLKLSNKINIANINMFLCNDLNFLRYVRGEVNRIATFKHLSYILCKEFGSDKEHLINTIKKHPQCKIVPLMNVVNTIRFLKKKYSTEDICSNIHIIFYSEKAIRVALDEISENYTADKGYNFTSSQYLALCLYILEKEYHFNGNSIWQGTVVNLPVLMSNNLRKAKIKNDLEEDDPHENIY